jgi:4'-phosphopantetheinyl transferase
MKQKLLPPTLAPGEVHVWQVRCDMDAPVAVQLWAELGEVDRLRAAKFVVDTARRQFMVGRALLYRLLARYLQPTAPGPIQLGHGPHGKLFLPIPQLAPPLEFNLAHSRDAVLLAFGRGHAVGVDVEAVAPLDDLDDLAAAYFSPGEQADLARRVGNAKLRGFYATWTRKEAWLKLIGTGIDRELNTLDLRTPPPGITLTAVPTWPGYVAALAVGAAPVTIRHQTLPSAASILAITP